ncbi:class I SAM-dependent methyltransferase [Paenibacillus daejeonensis]|uniref:class I SAM-dependent methyltransferase n=1 Tax=Paenibacillus daejeonensis TaxID=135193 RepID=UPI000592C43A|nr:class I SAM-dependent methyltransferase [Paenibacillus daejeonensis]
MLKSISSYWTSSAAGYDQVIRNQFGSPRTVAFWQSLLAVELGDRTGQQVMDVGTGPGFFSILLSRMGHRVTAVDASEGMIQRAQSNFHEYGCPVHAYVGDAADLSREADNSYDVIVSRDVVWTLPDPERAYAEWHRILKPGGKLIIFDGNYLYQDRRTPIRTLWKGLSWVLILVTEKRIRRRSKQDEGLLRELPYTQVLRPDADEQALAAAGFGGVQIQRGFMPAGAMPMHYLKYGHQNANRFKIMAVKPPVEDKDEKE